MRKIILIILLISVIILTACNISDSESDRDSENGINSNANPQAWIDAPLNESHLPFLPYEIVFHITAQQSALMGEISIDDVLMDTIENPNPSSNLATLRYIWAPDTAGKHIISVRAQGSDGIWGNTSSAVVYIGEETPNESGDCDPFEGQEISVLTLNINPETMVLPVYLRFPGAVPEIGEDGSMPYRGKLGSHESNLCNQQGFEDRLYCMFALPATAPGSVLTLEIHKQGCADPVFTQSGLTIPEIPQGPGCQLDLEPSICAAAGGLYVSNIDDPYCFCP